MNDASVYERYRRKGIFFVITGPSGAGKTTIMEKVLERDDRLSYSVSHTTRKPRPGEDNDVDYHFVEKDEFEQLRESGGFLEWAEFCGDYYGTSREEIKGIREAGSDPFLDIEVQGAEQLRDDPSIEAVFIFLVPPSLDELSRRITDRGADNAETRKKRIETARKELARIPEFDYLIVNDRVERAVSDLTSIIRAERLKI